MFGAYGFCDDIVEHRNVLRLLKADDAKGDDAQVPALNAYLDSRSTEQLRVYIASAEKEVDRRREHARLAVAAIAARRGAGAASPPRLRRPFRPISEASPIRS